MPKSLVQTQAMSYLPLNLGTPFANTVPKYKYMEKNPKEAESLCSQMIAWVAIRASKQHSSQIRGGENCAIEYFSRIDKVQESWFHS